MCLRGALWISSAGASIIKQIPARAAGLSRLIADGGGQRLVIKEREEIFLEPGREGAGVTRGPALSESLRFTVSGGQLG